MKRVAIALTLTAFVLAGCAEKAQSTAAGKKADSKAWELPQRDYAADGWKGGDQTAWESQMRLRAQGQNEYSRTAAAVPAATPTKTQ
jgi:hypothetical protein